MDRPPFERRCSEEDLSQSSFFFLNTEESKSGDSPASKATRARRGKLRVFIVFLFQFTPVQRKKTGSVSEKMAAPAPPR